MVVRRLGAVALAALLLAGCGGSKAATANPTATATYIVVGSPGPTDIPTAVASPLALTPGPDSTPQAAASPNPTAGRLAGTPASGQNLVVSGTGKSGLKLRASPDGKVVMLLTEGTALVGLGDQQKSGDYTWLHVRTTKGVEGWVASSYVAAAPGAAATAPAGGA